jgi:hypothetical protein
MTVGFASVIVGFASETVDFANESIDFVLICVLSGRIGCVLKIGCHGDKI